MSAGKSLSGTGFGIAYNIIDNGTVRVIITPPLKEPIPSIPNGEIAVLHIHINASAQENSIANITLSNLVASDSAGSSVDINAANGVVTVTSTIPGDANGDGQVNVQDLIIVVNDILGVSSGYNTDCNGDGLVNVQDIVCVTNIILNQ